MNDEELLKIQEQAARQLGYKVDVYHNERSRVIGIFPHGEPPTPFSAIKIIRY